MTAETVARLQTDVERLRDTERDYSLQLRAKSAQLESERPGETGDADLESQSAAVARRGRLESEIDALAATITATRRARSAAIVDVRYAEACDRRAAAERLHAEATERQVETNRLLAELREHEGVDYVPGPRPEYLQGGVGLAAPLQYGTHAATTTTDVLLRQAAEEERQAAELEGALVARSGTATGANVDELAEAVWSDPYRLGPTLAEICKWFADASVRPRWEWERDRLSSHMPVDKQQWDALPLRCCIVWRAGAILPDKSSVVVPRAPNGSPPHADNPPRVTGVTHAVRQGGPR